MSTKIYNGYRVTSGISADEFLEKLIALRPIAEHFVTQQMLEFVKSVAETRAFKNGIDYIHDALYEVEKTKQRNPLIDFTANIAVRRLNGTLYVMLFIENRKFEKLVTEALGLEYYGYWDNTDPPDGLTYEEFEERGVIWDNVMPHSVPSNHMFSYELISYTDQRLLLYTVSEIMRAVYTTPKLNSGD